MTALQLLINNCFITVCYRILLTIMVFAGVFLIIQHFSSLTEPQTPWCAAPSEAAHPCRVSALLPQGWGGWDGCCQPHAAASLCALRA